jgi:hypothetical protein
VPDELVEPALDDVVGTPGDDANDHGLDDASRALFIGWFPLDLGAGFGEHLRQLACSSGRAVEPNIPDVFPVGHGETVCRSRSRVEDPACRLDVVSPA